MRSRIVPFSQDTYPFFSNRLTDPPINAVLDSYLDLTRNELSKCRFVYPFSNLTSQQHLALLELSTLPNIIIIKADKGDQIVIMDMEQYLTLAYSHLDDKDTYLRLDTDPTTEDVSRLSDHLSSLLHLGFYQCSHLSLSQPHQQGLYPKDLLVTKTSQGPNFC